METSNHKKHNLAAVSIITAAFLWGSMGLFVRNLSIYNITSMEIVAIRAFGTTLMLAVLLLLYNRKLFKVKTKDLWCFVGSGVVSIVFFNYCYFTTITMTSLSVAAILLYTAPAIVTVLSAFLFKEKMTKTKTAALVIAFLGCVLVTGVLNETMILSPGGIVIGLGAGLGYALYSIFGRFALDRGYDSFTITFYTFVFASIGVAPFIDMTHLRTCMQTDVRSLWFAVGMVLFTTVIAYMVYTYGLSKMEAGNASILATLEPVVATLIGFLLYKESVAPDNFIGIILVLLSAILATR
ncbi:MAG: EamA family transporter [Lachnospiraceae bacterium]|nr:EamA family transporter [Lachnospiraceae bacterium]